ncbi:MAG: alpha/beta fold hydrolase [Actinomycetota bacterium]
MTTFLLVHGAYHSGAHWDLVARELRAKGHSTIAPDLPISDPELGAGAYAQTLAKAAREAEADDVVVVAHSMGGLSAPLAASMIPSVRGLVYLCAMVPTPGLSFNAASAKIADLWGSDPQVPPRANEDGSASSHPAHACEMYYHDCGWQRMQWACSLLRPQQWHVVQEVTPIQSLPEVPATFIVAANDRVVSPAAQRVIAREQLNARVIEIATGHSPMIAKPEETAGILAGL